MKAEAPKYIVGIDLGTTNTVVAYARGFEEPQLFEVPQLVTLGEKQKLGHLPSYLYSPLPAEGAGEQTWVVGEWARARAFEVPSRSIASAKSWLSHAQAHRTEKILPWGASDIEVPRLSPVEASARLLEHIRNAWNAEFKDAPLEAQTVILTVPASFDPIARKLTGQAALAAGLRVRLLEEPQAAFYALLGKEPSPDVKGLFDGESEPEPSAQEQDPSDTRSRQILVCDIGGGTTDFCLIRASLARDAIDLERTRVGRHLLLGGDNMDLSLAHHLEPQLTSDEEKLDPSSFSSLIHASRGAKERLLSEPGTQVERIVLASASSNLFQGLKSATLQQDLARSIVVEGFFPNVSLEARPQRRGHGLLAQGLPYESDARISAHLAEFFSREPDQKPGCDAVLFNGGVFHSSSIRARVLELLQAWFPERKVTALPSASLDRAVALGAVRYGQALMGHGTRIASGTAHGYYVLVGGRENAALLVSVVPRGAREDEVHQARVEGLLLRTNENVRFDVFASDRSVHAPGEVVPLVKEDFELLPPLATRFESQSEVQVSVDLEGTITPVGTLELRLKDRESEHRFELEFELRGQEVTSASSSMSPSEQRPLSRAPASTALSARLGQADEAIQRVFGKGRKDVKEREVRDLMRTLEKLFGERKTWDLKLCRSLFDVVAPKFQARRRSEDHERVYFMLTGLCLRPGFGDPLDVGRVALLTPLFDEGITFAQSARNWQAFFVAFRRVAAGLSEETSLKMRSKLDPFVAPEEAGLKKPKGFKPQALTELIELLSWLERVPAGDRSALGSWLLERTWTDRSPALWAAIGRVGARVPAYGSVHQVVAPKTVERWVDHLLREKWNEVPSLGRVAVELCRITGDRARDVSEVTRSRVLARLEALGHPKSEFEPLHTLVPVLEHERRARFDEDLPPGLSFLPPERQSVS